MRGPPAGARGRVPPRLILVGLKVLLHVVGAGELLGAPGVDALHALLGRVDLGVARSVAARREGLFAPNRFTKAAEVPLASAGFRRGRLAGRDELGVVRSGARGPRERAVLTALMVRDVLIVRGLGGGAAGVVAVMMGVGRAVVFVLRDGS